MFLVLFCIGLFLFWFAPVTPITTLSLKEVNIKPVYSVDEATPAPSAVIQASQLQRPRAGHVILPPTPPTSRLLPLHNLLPRCALF